MVKSVILLLILSIFSASVLVNAEVVCAELECVKRGKECGNINTRNNIYNRECESYEDTCYYTVGHGTEPYSSGTCNPKPTANQTCENVGACVDGYVCNYDFTTGVQKCQPATSQIYRPGQACSIDAQCEFENSDGTTTRQCISGICKYVTDGQQCSRGYDQCNVRTSECFIADVLSSTGVCRARTYLALGAPCDASGYLVLNQADCRFPLACIPGVNSTTGTCNYRFSQRENGGCTADSHCSKGYCVGHDSFPFTAGKCVAYKKTPTLNKYCIDDSYCSDGNGEHCLCLSNNKVQCRVSDVDIDYSKKYEKAYNCINQESVASRCGPNVRANHECYLNACKKDFCSYYQESKTDLVSDQTDLKDDYNDCLLRQVCDASAIFASLSFSLLAVVFVLFF